MELWQAEGEVVLKPRAHYQGRENRSGEEQEMKPISPSQRINDMNLMRQTIRFENFDGITGIRHQDEIKNLLSHCPGSAEGNSGMRQTRNPHCQPSSCRTNGLDSKKNNQSRRTSRLRKHVPRSSAG